MIEEPLTKPSSYNVPVMARIFTWSLAVLTLITLWICGPLLVIFMGWESLIPLGLGYIFGMIVISITFALLGASEEN